MKLVDGERLDQWVVRANPPQPARLSAFTRVCETAAFAHSRGVIHRDLKPRNIMVGAFGQVLVLDWGVAGLVAGTPEYAAPELAASGTADRRSDIYSLGAILRFLTAGAAAAPSPLRAIADRALAPAPADRYQDVDTLLADLESYRAGGPVAAYRESVFERAGRFVRRNQTLLLLLAAYVAVRLALLVWRIVR
jgi:serine/threonine-protein kinase